MTAMVWVM